MMRHRWGKLSISRLAALPMSIAIALGLAVSGSADIMVDLDATGLPEGPLETWSNTGYLGEDFIAEVDVPSVTTIDGVRGVTLDGENDWYVGPSAIWLADAADRTIEAWIYNPEMADEETIFSWGRRGGPDASNMAFNHGVNEVFGAVGHWGNPDIGWAGNYATGRWTYVAYTYDSWMTTSTVYFDGEYANSEGVGLLVTHAYDENFEIELPFVVGAQNQQNGTRFPGLTGSMTIARIRVHDYALTDAEISASFGAEAEEFGLGDADADGMPSEFESLYDFLDPFDASDAAEDFDNDGLTNLEEFQVGTEPDNPDTDGDGVIDGDEIAAGANPLDPDSDNDGILDNEEVALGTDPTKQDSDGDGYTDPFEIDWLSDPTDINSVPEGLPSSIGINFIGGHQGTSGPSVTGFAGVQEQAFWNNYGDVNTPTGGPGALTDDTGAASGATVTWSGAPNTWTVTLDPPADGNAALMAGYLDTGDPGTSTTTVVVDNIPYKFYDVILYLVRDVTGSSGDYSANGQMKLGLVHTTPWPIADGNGAFIEAPDSGTAGNYTVFNNLSGSTLTVTATAFVARGPLNGMQIVEVLDTDDDGLPDPYEEANGFDLGIAADAALDSDDDGLTNLEEFELGTDPNNPDSDWDFLNDGDEVAARSDPFNPDTDQDGLLDGLETTTDLNNPDTDGDQFLDGQEVFHGSDPNSAASTPVLDTPVPLVDLDSTSLAVGPLEIWPNEGAMQGVFWSEASTPEVVVDENNVKGVAFDGANNWYVGPPAPLSIAGNNSRSIVAWVYNPEVAMDEAVFAWGRRGGPDGTSMAFNHGYYEAFGAVGHWGTDGDVGWNGQEKAGVWTFISYTYDAALNRTCVYVDGELAQCEDHTVIINTWAEDRVGRALRFVLGNQNESSGFRTPDLSASMTISRLRVYDIPVDAAEITAQYNAELPYYQGQVGPTVPTIIGMEYSAGTGVTLSWTPETGVTYRVQASNNLTDWSDIATGIMGGSYSDPAALQDQRFYRVIPE